jgi:hypothetical protein
MTPYVLFFQTTIISKTKKLPANRQWFFKPVPNDFKEQWNAKHPDKPI